MLFHSYDIGTASPSRTTISIPVASTLSLPFSPSFNCPLFKLLGEGVVFPMIFILGITCNSLTLLTFRMRLKGNPTALLLMTLAVLDSVVLSVWTLMRATPAVCLYMNSCSIFLSRTFVVMRAYVWPVGSAAHLAGTWVIVFVTFHRFVGVCYPFKAQQWTNIGRTRWHVTIITILSLVYNIPPFVDDTIQEDSHSKYTLVKTTFGNNEAFNYFYSVGLYYMFIYLIPYTSLIHMSVKLIQVLLHTRKKKVVLNKARKEELEMTFTLVVMIMIFMVCQILNPIRRALALALDPLEQKCGTPYSFISYFSSLGIILNSAVNFVIFCVCGKRFRRDLKTVLHRKRHKIGPCKSATQTGTTTRVSDESGPQILNCNSSKWHEFIPSLVVLFNPCYVYLQFVEALECLWCLKCMEAYHIDQLVKKAIVTCTYVTYVIIRWICYDGKVNGCWRFLNCHVNEKGQMEKLSMIIDWVNQMLYGLIISSYYWLNNKMNKPNCPSVLCWWKLMAGTILSEDVHCDWPCILNLDVMATPAVCTFLFMSWHSWSQHDGRWLWQAMH